MNFDIIVEEVVKYRYRVSGVKSAEEAQNVYVQFQSVQPDLTINDYEDIDLVNEETVSWEIKEVEETKPMTQSQYTETD